MKLFLFPQICSFGKSLPDKDIVTTLRNIARDLQVTQSLLYSSQATHVLSCPQMVKQYWFLSFGNRLRSQRLSSRKSNSSGTKEHFVKQTWTESFYTYSRSILVSWFLIRVANLKNKENQSLVSRQISCSFLTVYFVCVSVLLVQHGWLNFLVFFIRNLYI